MKNNQAGVKSVFDKIVLGHAQVAKAPVMNDWIQAAAKGHEMNFPIKKRLEIPSISEADLMIQALKSPAKPARKNAPMQTIVSLLLDESGSMDNGCKQTMDGYNQQLDKLRENAGEIGCRVIQSNFSSQAYLIADNVEAEKLVNLTNFTYKPNGGTALYDTVAALIKHILQHPDAHDENTSILLSITTDGDDMGSKIWTADRLVKFRELLKAANENDRWTIALAGPDTKLRQFADTMSVNSDNVAAFIPDSIQSRSTAMDSSTIAMSSYVGSRVMGMKKSEMMYASTEAGAFAKSLLDNPKF